MHIASIVLYLPVSKVKCLDNKWAVRLHSDSLKIYHLTAEVEWFCTAQLGFTQNKLMQPLQSLLVVHAVCFIRNSYKKH